MEFNKNIEFNNKPTVSDELTVTYNGFLSDSQELSIVYGFGESWEHTTELKMEKTSQGFVAKIELLDFDTFNFCFKNSNNEWDNNSYCNYITPIAPCANKLENQNVQNFDIDSLIEELLQPIITSEPTQEISISPVSSEPVDLGVQISNILSTIDEHENQPELVEYSTLDEILTATRIEDSNDFISNVLIDDISEKSSANILDEQDVQQNVNIQSFEEITTDAKQPITSNVENIIQEQTENKEQENIFEDFIKNLSAITSNNSSSIQNVEKSSNEPVQKNNELVKTSDSFIVSSRQASKFYLFRKRIKLAFYKALIKIPKLIFGSEKN